MKHLIEGKIKQINKDIKEIAKIHKNLDENVLL